MTISRGIWAACLVLVGCGASSSPPAGSAPAPSASAAPVVAPEPAASSAAVAPTAAASAAVAPPEKTSSDLPATISVSKLHTDGNHYALDVKAPAVISKGGSGELEIVLSAKDKYHVNDKYPYKVTLTSEPAGLVTFPVPELARAAGTFTKTEARFKATFAAAKAGEGKVGGAFALSVCTAKECVVEKVQLEVPINIQ